MAQHVGDAFEADARAEHLTGRRVPKDVRAPRRGGHAGSLQGGPRDVPDRVAGRPCGKGPEGRHRAEEDERAGDPGTPVSQVREEGIAHVLREGQPSFSTALTQDPDGGELEVQVRAAQRRDVAGPEPEPDQEEEHRPISPAARRRRTHGKHVPDLFVG